MNDRTQRVAVGSVVLDAMHHQCGVHNQSVKFADDIILVITCMPMTPKYVIKSLDNWKNISICLNIKSRHFEMIGNYRLFLRKVQENLLLANIKTINIKNRTHYVLMRDYINVERLH